MTQEILTLPIPYTNLVWNWTRLFQYTGEEQDHSFSKGQPNQEILENALSPNLPARANTVEVDDFLQEKLVSND